MDHNPTRQNKRLGIGAYHFLCVDAKINPNSLSELMHNVSLTTQRRINYIGDILPVSQKYKKRQIIQKPESMLHPIDFGHRLGFRRTLNYISLETKSKISQHIFIASKIVLNLIIAYLNKI